MPRTLVLAPDHDRNRSLGWLAVAWAEFFVKHGPGSVMGQPVRHGEEYTGFIVDCYAVGDHPSNNHLLYDSVFMSRPKGADKSGMGARLGLFEALGPARFNGWAQGGELYRDPWGFGFEHEYQPGEPMGKHVTAPFIRCMATEQTQVGNVFETIYFNLTDKDACLLAHVPGVDAGLERVFLPWGGTINVSTASSGAKDGGRETFVVFDETHRYNTRELRDMYNTVTQNLYKRKRIDGTWFLETTTMFAPGEESVAEATYGEAEALREGRKKRGRHRLMYDHRYGLCPDLTDEPALRAALDEAYGEAAAWMDMDGLVDAFYDTRRSAANNRRFYLNGQTSTKDAWVAAHEWDACARPDLVLKDNDLVCLGGDGSVSDDATALVAVRISDGHMELLGCWEKPEGPEGETWQVDREAVDAAVSAAMRRFEVVGLYFDPAHWQDYLDRWHNEYAQKMRVKARADKPLEFWTNRPIAMVAALERFHEAILERRVSFTPAADRTGREQELALTLRRHVLNARRRVNRSGLQIGKDFPHSPHKIDAAMAATLAYTAAMDAVAAGIKPRGETRYAARRIR
jgi:hypothetical protein